MTPAIAAVVVAALLTCSCVLFLRKRARSRG